MAMRPVYASDIYALGATCLYLLTAKSPKDMGYNPATGEIDWQKYINISDHLAGVLQKMLEVSVRHRYQSAQEVLDALEMEPYMDSLAQGLATKPTQGQTEEDKTGIVKPFSSNPSPQSGDHSSDHSKLADAIRNRRSRRSGVGSGGDSVNPINRNRSLDNIGFKSSQSAYHKTSSGGYQRGALQQSNAHGHKKIPPRLNEQELLAAYRQGRRDFTDQNLSYLKLPEVDLSGAIFHQSKLNKTNFQGANLSNADFGRASLVQVNMQNANLGRAYFSASNLEGADFRGADLSFAYFSKANLKGVNFCGANLSNAKITPEQLALTKTNWATIKPDGKRGGFW
jgi:serine/threonine-protein kinase